MPTFTIETNVVTNEFRKRVAKKVSLWLYQQQIPINHVMIKFYELGAEHVFSGPFPFHQFPGETEKERPFAFITCQVAQERPAQFRCELAHKLAEAIQPEISYDRTFITFQLVDPTHHFTGTALGKELSR